MPGIRLGPALQWGMQDGSELLDVLRVGLCTPSAWLGSTKGDYLLFNTGSINVVVRTTALVHLLAIQF